MRLFPKAPISQTGTRSLRRRKKKGGEGCLFLNYMKDLVCFVSALLGPFLSGDKTNPLFNARSWFVQVLPRRMTLFNTLSGKTSPCLKRQSSLTLSTTTPTSSHQIGLGEGRTNRSPREKPNSEERPPEDLPGSNSSSRAESKEESNENVCQIRRRQPSPQHQAFSCGK